MPRWIISPGARPCLHPSAQVTLACLHEMFQSAKHIMGWLSECARLIAKEGQPVSGGARGGRRGAGRGGAAGSPARMLADMYARGDGLLILHTLS